MRPAALSIAVLLGMAILGGAQAHAMPTVSATITIENGHTVEIGGKRQHRDFRRKAAPHRYKTLSRHHKRWHVGRHHKRWHDGRHHKRWHDGRHHRPAFTKRVHRGPVVIVKPAFGRSFGHRHLPARRLMKHGKFARGPFRW